MLCLCFRRAGRSKRRKTGAPPVAATEMKDARAGLIPGAYGLASV